MFMGALLVHFGQGPVQIEMHFYFFVNLALLAVFANPMVIIAAAITAALHHAAFWYLLPNSVFNYEAPLWVVGVHALFVFLESVAACFIARSFFDNVVELEKKVMQRTAELESRNVDMRMLLNSVQEGFFTIDESGIISAERSAIVEKWLGPIEPRQTFEDYIANHDADFADWFGFSLSEVFNSLLPVELLLDQLPKRFVAVGKTFECTYSPVESNEREFEAVAVIMRDITAIVEREKLETENREMIAIVDQVAINRSGFVEFFDECSRLIKEIRAYPSIDPDQFGRQIHTLKGNAGLFGLYSVAEACHSLENTLLDDEKSITEASLSELLDIWSATELRVSHVIGERQRGIEIPERRYSTLIEHALGGTNAKELGLQLAALRLTPLRPRLETIAVQAKKLAKRLGKGDIHVYINDENIRIDSKAWSDFWSSFVHVVRNAIDHGLETPDDRDAIGKPTNGQIEINVQASTDEFSISLSDDGAGIDWDKIRNKAIEFGLPVSSKQNLIDALFTDGLSAAETVSDISGRGVGMQAVKDACLNLGGTINVETESDVGTKVHFSFPIETIASKTFDMLRKNGVSNAETKICSQFSELAVRLPICPLTKHEINASQI